MREHGNKIETYGKRYAWFLVFLFTTLSVTLNSAHAVLGMSDRSGVEQALSALVAAVAPLSLVLATELVVQLIRGWGDRTKWLPWLRGFSAAVTVVIGGLAFATSFVALMDMAELMGVAAGLTWALPGVIDAMIIIATLAVVIAEAEMALDRAEAVEAAEAEVAGPVAERSVTTELAGVADPAPAAHVAEVVDQPAIDPVVADHPANHPATVVADPVVEMADQDSDQEVGPVVGPADVPAAEVHIDQLEVAGPVPATTEVAESGMVADQPEVAGPVADEPATEAVADLVEESVADHPASHPTTPVVDPVVAEVADRVRETTSTTKTTEEIVQVLELAESGLSQRAIAAEVGIDRSVISRLIKAAEAEPRPVLAAVN